MLRILSLQHATLSELETIRLLTLHVNADSAPFNRENGCQRPGKLDSVWAHNGAQRRGRVVEFDGLESRFRCLAI